MYDHDDHADLIRLVRCIKHNLLHCIQSCQYFTPAEGFDLTALEGNPNPFVTETEREIATRKKGLPVYRMLFRRNATPYGGDIGE